MIRLSHEAKLILLILTALVLQIIGRYYSKSFLIFTSFDTLKFLLAAILPLILGRLFLFDSFKEMGLGLPQLKAREWGVLLAIGVLIPLVITLVRGSEDYLQYYQSYRQNQVPLAQRLQRFSLFALSTITGWEILHRGFLLPGLRKHFSTTTAILWIMSFEVTYHFVKPDLETWGMLVFSPLASYLVVRSKSIWPSLALHLWIEVFFILNITASV
jgi:membrane protease YdiL (CAAX protease family)